LWNKIRHLVKIKKGEYSILNAIHTITKNPKPKAKLIDNHIVSYLSDIPPLHIDITASEKKKLLVVKGTLYDEITQKPIPSASVSLNTSNIGIVTNLRGEFNLVLPDSLNSITIKFSHLGYENRELIISALTNQNTKIYLTPTAIPLQEIAVRTVNPILIIQNMLKNRVANYSTASAILTIFYREIITYKGKEVNVAEGVLDILQE
jgi:hypothetical protein